jgi:hypothetical protein
MKRLLATVLGAAAISGCAVNTGLLVRFPIGNTTRGREAFVALECHACHRIDGIDLPPPSTPTQFSVPLGGHTPRIETYGDIVTAIVNPSHRIARSFRNEAPDGKSPMEARYLNEVMTTQQLIDIAAFLRLEYDYIPPPAPPYWQAYPGGDYDFGASPGNR